MIVGVGILGLPYVFYNVGIVIGLLLLILVALGTVLSYWFLLQSSNMSRQHSYEDLAQFSMGSIASIITKIIIIVDTFGSLAAYMVVGSILFFSFQKTETNNVCYCLQLPIQRIDLLAPMWTSLTSMQSSTSEFYWRSP